LKIKKDSEGFSNNEVELHTQRKVVINQKTCSVTLTMLSVDSM